jgi:ubiquinone/menaquinone biosynthesis C-methylase UbiE
MDRSDEAAAYAEADFCEVNEAFIERLLELAGPADSMRVCDLGTGPADIPLRLARRRPAWQLTAVDIAPAMLDLARQALRQAGLERSVELVLADAKHLTAALPLGGFDAVISNSILHHVSDVRAYWQQAAALAGKNALFFHRDLARPDSEAQARQIVQQYATDATTLLQEEYYRSLLAAYTPEEVRMQLHRAGLDGLEVRLSSDRHLDIFGRVHTDVQ